MTSDAKKTTPNLMAVAVLAVIATITVASFNAMSRPAQLHTPAELSGLMLRNSVQGRDAESEFRELSGMPLKASQTYVNYYGDEAQNDNAVVALAIVRNNAAARDAVDQLLQANSSRPGYTPPASEASLSMAAMSMPVYKTTADGLTNYFTAYQNMVFWIRTRGQGSSDLIAAALSHRWRQGNY